MGSEVAGGVEDTQLIRPKSKTLLSRTVRLENEQPPGSSAQEKKVSGLTSRPVSVERLEQDKHEDENLDEDHVGTARLVENEQSIGLFTQREYIDIDFRVSGLPHTIVSFHVTNEVIK